MQGLILHSALSQWLASSSRARGCVVCKKRPPRPATRVACCGMHVNIYPLWLYSLLATIYRSRRCRDAELDIRKASLASPGLAESRLIYRRGLTEGMVAYRSAGFDATWEVHARNQTLHLHSSGSRALTPQLVCGTCLLSLWFYHRSVAASLLFREDLTVAAPLHDLGPWEPLNHFSELYH